jgi:hypothetical protein
MKETSMSVRRIFIDETMETPSSEAFYRKGFELIIRLDDDLYDYTMLRVIIPVDEKANPKTGTYNIKDNLPEADIAADIIYTPASANTAFPSAKYSTGQDKFNFNMALRIENFDPVTHEIAGYIDELRIADKSNPSKNINLKELGFTLVFDHFEVYLDDVLAYEGTTDPYGGSYWYTGSFNSKMFSTTSDPVFKFGMIAFNLIDFKGTGNYAQNGEYDAVFNTFNNGITMNELTGAEVVDGFSYPTFYTVGANEVKVDTWLENVLIRGSISGPTTQIWGNNAGGWYADTRIPGRPDYELKGYFFQRQL